MENSIKIFKSSIRKIENKYFNRNERDFSYELYHQLRCEEIKYDFEITCETPKSVAIPNSLMQNAFFVKHFFQRQNFDLENDQFSRTPDLLFHNYQNRNHQLIAVEIKPLSTTFTKIYKDLAKLMFYVKCSLKYKKAVLLLFGNNDGEGILEIPEIRKVLLDFPEIEIWIAKPKQEPIILK